MLDEINRIDLESCIPAKKRTAYDVIKRGADLILSLAASAVIFIPCFVIAALIKAEDGGSVFYCHMRTGEGGKPIKVYKFRSMRQGADNIELSLTPEQAELYRKEYKLQNDPRVSRIGAFLRKTSLDELPQIFMNVLLLGNMSLVGPRPVLEEETRLFGAARNVLLSVKPGLTGFWAAYSDSKISYTDGSRQKMELYYIQNRSVLLDIKIIFRTVGKVFEKAFGKNY